MSRTLQLSIQVGDAFDFKTDVLALKYAQAPYGVDRVALARLEQHLLTPRLPGVGESVLVDTRGSMAATQVLFVGVKTLSEFGYPEIREFAHRVLNSLAHTTPHATTLALTAHGPGYGLDEIEAFKSELAGLVDGISSGDFPDSLVAITFIEQRGDRAQRLVAELNSFFPDGSVPVNRPTSVLAHEAQNTLRSAGYASAAKPHVFVAMPFAKDMEDVFYYGIQGAVNSAGLLCERADLSTFTGDVMDWVKRRIASASLVVADLSSANPNVYLEVGYAWGCRVPTVLLARQADDLKFDVKSQRCILYESIHALEDELRRELQGLQALPEVQ